MMTHPVLNQVFNDFNRIFSGQPVIACNHKNIIQVKSCCSQEPIGLNEDMHEADMLWCKKCNDHFELVRMCEDCGADLEDIPEEII